MSWLYNLKLHTKLVSAFIIAATVVLINCIGVRIVQSIDTSYTAPYGKDAGSMQLLLTGGLLFAIGTGISIAIIASRAAKETLSAAQGVLANGRSAPSEKATRSWGQLRIRLIPAGILSVADRPVSAALAASAFLMLLVISSDARAQGVLSDEPSQVQLDLGAGLVSRHIWRGTDFGDAPNAQPYLSVQVGSLGAGLWATYTATNNSFAEQDLWVSYAGQTKLGTTTVTLTDYFFPYAGLEYFDVRSGGRGAHTVEASLKYSPPVVPLYLLGAMNVHNDRDRSAYIELGYTPHLENVDLAFSLGAALGRSAWYGVSANNPALIQASLTATKMLSLSEGIHLPVSASFVVNPYAKKSFVAVGVRI